MSLVEPLSVLLLISIVLYWFNAMQAKEVARREGRLCCHGLGLLFLDDSVVLKKVRLARSELGQVILRREYQFEFSSDGSQRYRGKISLMGKTLDDVIMEAYREPESDPPSSLDNP